MRSRTSRASEPRLDVRDLGQLLRRELALQGFDRLLQVFGMTPALDEPRHPIFSLMKIEAPCGLRAVGVGRAAKNESTPWVENRHTRPGSVGMHPNFLSGVQLLQLAAQFQHVVDVAAGKVLEDLMAEETTAALTDLHEPRPDGGARRQYRDGVRVRPRRRLHDFIARQPVFNLVPGRIPSCAPAMKKRSGREVESNQESTHESVEQPFPLGTEIGITPAATDVSSRRWSHCANLGAVAESLREMWCAAAARGEIMGPALRSVASRVCSPPQPFPEGRAL